MTSQITTVWTAEFIYFGLDDREHITVV